MDTNYAGLTFDTPVVYESAEENEVNTETAPIQTSNVESTTESVGADDVNTNDQTNDAASIEASDEDVDSEDSTAEEEDSDSSDSDTDRDTAEATKNAATTPENRLPETSDNLFEHIGPDKSPFFYIEGEENRMFNFESTDCQEDIDMLLDEDNREDMFRLILTDVEYYIGLIQITKEPNLQDLLQILVERITTRNKNKKGELTIKFKFGDENSEWHEVGFFGDSFDDTDVYTDFKHRVEALLQQPFKNKPRDHKNVDQTMFASTSKPTKHVQNASSNETNYMVPQDLNVSKREKYLRKQGKRPPITHNNTTTPPVRETVDDVASTISSASVPSTTSRSSNSSDESTETVSSSANAQIDQLKSMLQQLTSQLNGVQVKNINLTFNVTF